MEFHDRDRDRGTCPLSQKLPRENLWATLRDNFRPCLVPQAGHEWHQCQQYPQRIHTQQHATRFLHIIRDRRHQWVCQLGRIILGRTPNRQNAARRTDHLVGEEFTPEWNEHLNPGFPDHDRSTGARSLHLLNPALAKEVLVFRSMINELPGCPVLTAGPAIEAGDCLSCTVKLLLRCPNNRLHSLASVGTPAARATKKQPVPLQTRCTLFSSQISFLHFCCRKS